ncbi:hypothetical protein LTR08_005018 [Meristemomyces frigidus]|nr:hypothetical protein LTR08_005018 [Meristemomyces frigidus]
MGPRAAANRIALAQQIKAKLSERKRSAINAQRALDQAPSVIRQPVLKKETKPKPVPPTPLPFATSTFGGHVEHLLPKFVPTPAQRSVPAFTRPGRSNTGTLTARKPKKKPSETSISRRKVKVRLPTDSLTALHLTHQWDISYGGIDELRSILGFRRTPGTPFPNTVLVAVDTECERSGLVNNVVEIGVTTLRVRDVAGVPPGLHLCNWMRHMSHFHIVVDVTRKPIARMSGSLFGRSRLLSTPDARDALRAILLSCGTDAQQAGQQDSPPEVMLVGQSIISDILSLARPSFRFDIHDPLTAGVHFTRLFDTVALAARASHLGARFPSKRLGPLVRSLGVHPQYHNQLKNELTVIGTHNASNDAAYTMMALLLFAVRWGEIVNEAVLEPGDGGGKPRETVKGLKQQYWRKGLKVLLGSMGAVVLAGAGLSFVRRLPMTDNDSVADEEGGY